MSTPNPHPAQEASPLRLDELNADALSKLFEHLKFKVPLELTCRALRDAAPALIHATISVVVDVNKLGGQLHSHEDQASQG